MPLCKDPVDDGRVSETILLDEASLEAENFLLLLQDGETSDPQGILLVAQGFVSLELELVARARTRFGIQELAELDLELADRQPELSFSVQGFAVGIGSLALCVHAHSLVRLPLIRKYLFYLLFEGLLAAPELLS